MTELRRSGREEVLEEVRRHLATLNDRLDELQAKGVSTRPEDVDREMTYIDRAASSAPKAVRKEMDGEIEQVRERVTALKRKNVAFALMDTSVEKGAANSFTSQGSKEFKVQGQGPASQRSFMQKVQSLGSQKVQSFQIRSWKSVDDSSEQSAYADLAGQAAQLREVAEEVAVHVDNDQQKLDNVAEETSNTKENVRAAVSSVTAASRAQARRWNFIGLAVALLVMIVGVLVARATDASIAVPIGVGLAIGLVVHCLSMAGKNAQAKGLEAVKDRVQEANSWPPLPADTAEQIFREGLDAEARVLELLDGSWGTATQLTPGMHLSQLSGTTFRVTLDVRLDSSAAFRLVERLRNEGGLDPGCQAMWARPIDNDGTSLRYSVHDIWFMNRDFLTVCRFAPMTTPDGRNRYLLSATSLSPDVSDIVESEHQRRWMIRGEVRSMGLSVEDLDEASSVRLSATWPMEAKNSQCRVDIVLDVDVRLCCGAGRVARRYAIAIGEQLSSTFAAAAEARLQGSVEMRDF